MSLLRGPCDSLQREYRLYGQTVPNWVAYSGRKPEFCWELWGSRQKLPRYWLWIDVRRRVTAPGEHRHVIASVRQIDHATRGVHDVVVQIARQDLPAPQSAQPGYSSAV
jgi:hypothetical protein